MKIPQAFGQNAEATRTDSDLEDKESNLEVGEVVEQELVYGDR
jgi:hypothetical protein